MDTTDNRRMTDNLWTQPNSAIMRVRWDKVEVTGFLNRILLQFSVGIVVYYVLFFSTKNDMLALFVSLGVILLISIIMSLRSASKRYTENREAVETRNRELVEAVRQKTDWHPASFNLVFSATRRGNVNIYDGSVDEALNSIRAWYQNDVLRGEVTCRHGHDPLCKHNAPSFFRWITQNPTKETGSID